RDRPVARDEDRDLVPGAGQRFRQRGRDVGQAAGLDERRELRGQEADVEASLRHGDRSRLARLDAAPSAGVLFRETRHKEHHMRRAAAVFVLGLKSTEVNFNFTSQTIARLPLERSYRGLFQLVPGVAENRSSVGPSGGGSRQDNTYLIDGVNITNPGFGYLSTEVNPLDIAEFNIKRGAITAEFGRSAGFVANAVSKSGTNDIHGAARFDWMPQGLISDFKQNAF